MFQTNLHRLLLFGAMALTTLIAAPAHGGTCNLDQPLQWTLNPTYVDNATASAITGDGSPYVNGQSGVTATIKVCTGTNDAVLSNTSRTITFSFAKKLASNANTPSFASSGGAVIGPGLLNIRNITFVPSVPAGLSRADEYTFTTWMGSDLPVKGTWNFRIFNPVTDAESGNGIWVTANNTPYLNSPVIAHHCPANSTATAAPCAGVLHETWFVYPDSNVTESGTSQTGLPKTQVGALVNTQKSTPVNGGQFSMPFYFTITSLQ